MHTSTFAALALVSALPLLAQEPEPEAFTPLFNGQNLDGWDTSGVKKERVTVSEGVLRLKGKSGWLLVSGKYRDFVLRFDAKVMPRSVAGVLLRMMPTEGRPVRGLEVRIADGKDRGGALLFWEGRRWVEAVPNASTMRTADDWQSFTVECREEMVRVLINGRVVQNVGGVITYEGRLGVHAERGVIELRNVWMVLPDNLPHGDVRPTDNGVTMPMLLLHDAKPQYTPQAMKARVQGEVQLECVVLLDGTVGRVTVVRSLSLDLDAQAVAAAKQWRFKPGTRNGEPAAVTVTISMTFSLR